MKSNTISFLSLLSCLLLLVLPFPITTAVSPQSPAAVTAVFAFGDSTVDPGNNNHIPTIFRSNHHPYGRDFPGKVPTGRFSNGKLTADFMTSFFRLKPVLPAYLDPAVKDVDLLTGVSFGSAGSGLDPRTARRAGAMSMDEQFELFQEALRRIKGVAGELEANRVIKNALFVISVGTNDVVFSVYDSPVGSLRTAIPEYHDYLLREVHSFIQRLHSEGARRFVVAGLPPVGCLPFQLTLQSSKSLNSRCVERQNNESLLYNTKLKSQTFSLTQRLRGCKVAYLDIYTSVLDMAADPDKYGFGETSRGCCGTGTVEMGPMCGLLSSTCRNASEFLFWDAVHLTQRAYSILAEFAINTTFLHI